MCVCVCVCVCLGLLHLKYTVCFLHYTVTRAPQRWECRLNHKDQFFFLLMLVRMVMVTCWWLWTCLLCILGELYAKYQYVILCELLFKNIYIWLYLQLLTGGTVLRAFWESTSGVIILILAQIKFTFIFPLLLLFSCPVTSNSFVTPWIGNIQGRILEWVCHFLSPGDFPNSGIEPTYLACISCIAGELSHWGIWSLMEFLLTSIICLEIRVKDENILKKNQMNMLYWMSLWKIQVQKSSRELFIWIGNSEK